MCLTIGVNQLDSTTEIQLVLYFQCTFGAPVCSAKTFMYFQIALVLLIALCMYLIYPSVKSESTAVLICTFQRTEMPRRV